MKLDYCIFFQLAKANQIGSRFLGQKVAKLNITPVQALVLGFLRDEDRITSSELGKRTELDSATLTGIIDRLEAAELIERRGNPADRRSIQVHLTERGRFLGSRGSPTDCRSQCGIPRNADGKGKGRIAASHQKASCCRDEIGFV